MHEGTGSLIELRAFWQHSKHCVTKAKSMGDLDDLRKKQNCTHAHMHTCTLSGLEKRGWGGNSREEFMEKSWKNLTSDYFALEPSS